MPIRITPTIGSISTLYAKPFVGKVEQTAQIKLQVSTFTNKEIDSKGYLKPGVPVQRDGTLLSTGDVLFGVTVEPIKIADDNESATISALDDVTIAVATAGQVQRAIAEDNLDRAYTADELAAFEASRGLTLLFQP